VLSCHPLSALSIAPLLHPPLPNSQHNQVASSCSILRSTRVLAGVQCGEYISGGVQCGIYQASSYEHRLSRARETVLIKRGSCTCSVLSGCNILSTGVTIAGFSLNAGPIKRGSCRKKTREIFVYRHLPSISNSFQDPLERSGLE
jgi:hypothetical protein